MRKLVTWGSYCVWLALTILTILFILYYTIFTRDIGTIRIFKGPFWELRDHMWKDLSLNILLFVPFGVMIGWKFGLKGVVAGFFISVMIEAIQYRWALGYTEVDDAHIPIGFKHNIRWLDVAVDASHTVNISHRLEDFIH